MNDKDLIKAYKELKNSEAPDLWSRIEGSIDTASSAEKVNGRAQEQPITERPDKILPLKKYNKFIFSSAAVILVVLVATAVIGSPLMHKLSDRLPMSETAGSNHVPGITEDYELSQNTDGEHEPHAYPTMPTMTEVPTTTFAPPLNTTDKQPAEEQDDSQKAEDIPGGNRGEFSDQTVYDLPTKYEDLKLANVRPVRLPTVTAAQSPLTRYFTVDAFADTELLVQATVENIDFIFNDNKEAVSVVYTVTTNNVYYSEGDYPTAGRFSDGTELLTITSPIIKADEVWMYPLLVNRSYLLPLTVTDKDAINLVFPYAPQIELSLDGFCVFHSGWQALINDNTGYLLVECVHPDDYFYDRMLVRPADGLAKDLIRIIKSLKN